MQKMRADSLVGDLRVLPVSWIETDSNTRGDEQFMTVKLVAPDARHHVVFTSTGAQSLGHMTERTISCLITEGVVYLLEAVKVAKDESERMMAALRRSQCPVKVIFKEGAVGEPGHGVMQGNVVEFRR